MLNRILLICLLLFCLQITAFAIETEEKPTRSWFSLFLSHKITPEINDQDLVQLRITQKPKLEKVKKCSFLHIFRTLFMPAKKMAEGNIVIPPLSIKKEYLETVSGNEHQKEEEISDSPIFIQEIEESVPFFVTSESPSLRKIRFSSNEDLIYPKQEYIEFIPISKVSFFQDQEEDSDDEFDDEFSYKFPDITDENLTYLANDLIKGRFPFCIIGRFGKCYLNIEHSQFTEELSFDTSWFIKKDDSKVTGLAIRFYDDDNKKYDEDAIVIYKTLLIPE